MDVTRPGLNLGPTSPVYHHVLFLFLTPTLVCFYLIYELDMTCVR